MKPFQPIRNSPYLRSASRQIFNAASRTRPNNLNLLIRHPSSSRRPLSNLPTRAPRRNPFSAAHNTPIRRPYSTRPPPGNSSSSSPSPGYNPTPTLNSPPPPLSLSQRLRKLSREYGWAAFGVYMLFTALDFPFCFAAVRYLGADRIGRYEHAVVEWAKSAVPESVREVWRKRVVASKQQQQQQQQQGEGEAGQGGTVAVGVVPGYDHGVKEAEKRNNETENASEFFFFFFSFFSLSFPPISLRLSPKDE